MTSSIRLAALMGAALVAASIGCESSPEMPQQSTRDSGTRSTRIDSGASLPDAQFVLPFDVGITFQIPDAGGSLADAGSSTFDAGSSPIDAGAVTTPTDSGTTTNAMDSGTTTNRVDSGAPMTRIGSSIGLTWPDAATTPVPDSGRPASCENSFCIDFFDCILPIFNPQVGLCNFGAGSPLGPQCVNLKCQ